MALQQMSVTIRVQLQSHLRVLTAADPALLTTGGPGLHYLGEQKPETLHLPLGVCKMCEKAQINPTQQTQRNSDWKALKGISVFQEGGTRS